MIHDRFRRNGGAVFIRTAARVIKAVANDDFANRNAKAAGDIDVSLLLKAATSPATTSSSNWAGSLASSAVADFIGSLGPISAAARLIAAGVTASLDGVATSEIPRRQGGKCLRGNTQDHRERRSYRPHGHDRAPVELRGHAVLCGRADSKCVPKRFDLVEVHFGLCVGNEG